MPLLNGGVILRTFRSEGSRVHFQAHGFSEGPPPKAEGTIF